MSDTTADGDGFQSTLSVRRATLPVGPLVRLPVISIHALRKESDHHLFGCRRAQSISIHALRKESDARNSANAL